MDKELLLFMVNGRPVPSLDARSAKRQAPAFWPAVKFGSTRSRRARPATEAERQAWLQSRPVAAAPSADAEVKGVLRVAHELLAQSAGEALGIALSGKDHSNPDEVLEALFRRHNDFLNKVLSPLLRRLEGGR